MRHTPFALTLVLAALACAVAPTPSNAQTARYRLTVDTTWSEATHPGAFPPAAHLSWLGGGTHDDRLALWSVGALASPGMVEMAETGATHLLESEVEAAVDDGHGGQVLAWHQWFCPEGTVNPSCGPGSVAFDVDASHPLVTLVTMLGPSPDWFVGTQGLPLRQDGSWVDEVVVPLHPFDAGTRDANAFALFGPQTLPPRPISPITAASGQLVGPASLGTFTFTRIDPFVEVGEGLVGDFAPALAGSGSLGTGEAFAVTAAGLPPATTAFVFLGLTAIHAPLLGGVLVPTPTLTLVDGTGPGTLVLAGTMPPGISPGSELFIQVWAPDTGGPAGACATNGLRLRKP